MIVGIETSPYAVRRESRLGHGLVVNFSMSPMFCKTT
jgi:hypothetical protein